MSSCASSIWTGIYNAPEDDLKRLETGLLPCSAEWSQPVNN
jgi:hypothetical protein